MFLEFTWLAASGPGIFDRGIMNHAGITLNMHRSFFHTVVLFSHVTHRHIVSQMGRRPYPAGFDNGREMRRAEGKSGKLFL